MPLSLLPTDSRRPDPRRVVPSFGVRRTLAHALVVGVLGAPLAAQATWHDVLAPDLRVQLEQTEPGERLHVYVVLADQLDADAWTTRLRAEPAGQRHAILGEALRAHAAASQVGVRAVLAEATAAGTAALDVDLWMGNALAVHAEAHVVAALAAVPGVDRIRPVLTPPVERMQDVGSPPPGVGAMPFFDDFESGTLLPHWTLATTAAGQVTVTGDHGPMGDYHAVFEASVDGTDSIASLTVQLDLTGRSDVGIRFKQKEFGDESHPEDAVLVSDDMVVWHEIESLQNGPENYETRILDLDAFANANSLAYTSTFGVRFQWRDNFGVPTDGMAFDDIEIGPGAAEPLVEPNIVAQRAPELWELGFDGNGVLVGIIDGGTWFQHPDLIGRTWTNPGEIPANGLDDDGNGYADDMNGWDFEHGNADPSSFDAHGTTVAGLVLGDGSSGQITGMAPGAQMVICEIASELDYWAAQQYLLDLGVDVVTSSYSFKWPDAPDYAMHRQFAKLELAAGIPHANSTGNQGNQLLTHPVPFNVPAPANAPGPWRHPGDVAAGRSSMVAVGAITMPDDALYNPSGRGPAAWEDVTLYDPSWPHGQVPAFFDYPYGGFGGPGPGLLKPDLVAYTNVMTTALTSGYTVFGGTSAATPQVGGALALLRHVQPAALPRHLSAALQLGAVDLGPAGKDNEFGAGRLDVLAAARRLQVLVRADPPVATIGGDFDLHLHGAPNDLLWGFLGLGIDANPSGFQLTQPWILIPPLPLDANGELSLTIPAISDPAGAGLSVWFQFGKPIQDLTWGPGPLLSVPEEVQFSL